MAKRILIIAIIFHLVGSLSSQEWNTYYYIGIGRSEIWSSHGPGEFIHYQEKAFNLGIGFEIPPGKSILSVRGDILFQTKGDNYKNLKYITIPAVIKFNIGKTKPFSVYGGGGFYGSVLVAYNSKSELFDPNRIEFGIVFNFGFKYKFKDKYGVFLEWSAYNGISSLYNYEAKSPGGAHYWRQYKNYAYYINLGFIYKIKSPF